MFATLAEYELFLPNQSAEQEICRNLKTLIWYYNYGTAGRRGRGMWIELIVRVGRIIGDTETVFVHPKDDFL